MGKNNLRRMMMLRDHDKNREPERDRLEEERDRREREMERRLRKVGRQIAKAGGVDILLSHAPAAGWGDADDFAHRGFECFNDFLDKYQPKYHVHGHVHMNYGSDIPRTLQLVGTTRINASDKYIL